MLGGAVPAAPQPKPDSEATNQDSKQTSGPIERVVFRELDSVTLEGIFQHITNAAIFIEWRPSKAL